MDEALFSWIAGTIIRCAEWEQHILRVTTLRLFHNECCVCNLLAETRTIFTWQWSTVHGWHGLLCATDRWFSKLLSHSYCIQPSLQVERGRQVKLDSPWLMHNISTHNALSSFSPVCIIFTVWSVVSNWINFTFTFQGFWGTNSN